MSVCVSVCPSVCVLQLFLPCSYHLIFMKLTQNIRLKSLRSHGLFEVFIMSASSLCAYLTNPLHILHKYNPRNDDVSHTTSRSKGWRSRSQRLLEFCHACSMALCLYGRSVSYVAQIQPRGPQCVTHHFPFIRPKVQVTQAVCSFGHTHSVSHYPLSQSCCSSYPHNLKISNQMKCAQNNTRIFLLINTNSYIPVRCTL